MTHAFLNMAQYEYVYNDMKEALLDEDSGFNSLTEASMLPISRSAHPKGGRYCILRGCHEARRTYNTMRDHLFFHYKFRKQMRAHDVNYEKCCETPPPFMNENRRMLHRFKYCKNAQKNLEHIMSKVWDKTESHIYDDGFTMQSDM